MRYDIKDLARPMRLPIWDMPVRLFHWTLVAMIAVAWWTAEQRMLDWHRLSGYTILTLLLFRLVWGIVGSATARFSSFIRGPSALLAYMRMHMFRRDAAGTPGHNPLGGWSVVAMLTVLGAQVGLGFLAVDIDGIESGPFSYLVEFDTGRFAAEWHASLFNILLAFIAMHVAAVGFYLVFRRDNLIAAMITGSRRWAGERPILYFAPGWLAFVILLVCGGSVWLLIRVWGQA